MTAEVRQNGERWGTADVTQQNGLVRFHISGPLRTDAVYRVWGRSAGREPLLLGVAEPQGDRLVLDRARSCSELSLFGYRDVLPEEYVLAVREPVWTLPEYTGDELIDHAIDIHHLSVEQEGDIVRIRCPFRRDAEFPLAFAFCLCRVVNGEAVLEWTKQQIEPETDE
ncbi:MAG: hypothetical protein ACI4PQ_08470 [Butyricicoccaceae bacterium]